MTASYSPLCHLDVLHEYLDGEGYPSFSLVPSSKSQKYFATSGIIFRQQGFRVTMYDSLARSEKRSKELLFPKELTFAVLASDPAFLQYTDLRVVSGKVTCFSTTTRDKQGAGGPLARKLVVPIDEWHLSGGGHMAALVSIQGRLLASIANGRGTRLSTIAPVYTATFPARSTFWRYEIFTNMSPPDSFSIREREGRSGPATCTFTRVEGSRGPGAAPSIAFESDKTRPIPMRAHPIRQFQLLQNERVVIESLPTPDLSFSRPSGGGDLCFNMVVYL